MEINKPKLYIKDAPPFPEHLLSHQSTKLAKVLYDHPPAVQKHPMADTHQVIFVAGDGKEVSLLDTLKEYDESEALNHLATQ